MPPERRAEAESELCAASSSSPGAGSPASGAPDAGGPAQQLVQVLPPGGAPVDNAPFRWHVCLDDALRADEYDAGYESRRRRSSGADASSSTAAPVSGAGAGARPRRRHCSAQQQQQQGGRGNGSAMASRASPAWGAWATSDSRPLVMMLPELAVSDADLLSDIQLTASGASGPSKGKQQASAAPPPGPKQLLAAPPPPQPQQPQPPQLEQTQAALQHQQQPQPQQQPQQQQQPPQQQQQQPAQQEPAANTSSARVAAAALAQLRDAAPAAPASGATASFADDAPASSASASNDGGGAAAHAPAAGAPSAARTALLHGRPINFIDPAFEQAISRWTKEAPDWFAVNRIVHRWSRRLNALHVALLLTKLAGLAETTHRRMLRSEAAAFGGLLEQLCAQGRRVAAGLDGQSAAVTLHALLRLVKARKVRQAVVTPFVADILVCLQPMLPSLPPRDLSTLIWSLGNLRHAPDDDWLATLFGCTRPALRACSPAQIALILSGVSRLGAVPPPGGWREALLVGAQDAMPAARSRELCMMLAAAAKLPELRPGAPWLEAVLAELRSRFDVLGPQALANTIWALARLHFIPDRSWQAAYYAASYQLLNSFNAAELSNAVWALAVLRLEPPDQWLDEFFDQSEAKLLASFRARDLAMSGWALAKLGMRPPQSWLRRYCGALLRRKGQLTPATLNQAMYALATLKVPNLDGWRRELYAGAGLPLSRRQLHRTATRRRSSGGSDDEGAGSAAGGRGPRRALRTESGV